MAEGDQNSWLNKRQPGGRFAESSVYPSVGHGAWLYGLVDLLIVALVVGFGLGILAFIEIGNAPFAAAVTVDTSPGALPGYALLSTVRSILALGLSYIVAIAYGTLAARSPAWERVLIPALDVFQSLPVLTFMPGLVLGLMSIFPESRWGLELACVLMIFSGQMWNLAFAYYESQRSMPTELRELSQVLRLPPVRRFFVLDLPNGMRPLVYNGMMSMAGGWFFLTLCESFMLGERSYKLPGLGSYLHETYLTGEMASFAWGLVTLVAIVVGFDFLLWKPLVAWVSRFRGGELSNEDGGDSTIADLWPGLRLPRWTRDLWRRFVRRRWELWSKARAEKVSSLRSRELHQAQIDGMDHDGAPVAPGMFRSGPKGNPWVDQLIFSPLGQVMRSSEAIFVKPAKRIVPRIFGGWGQWVFSFAAGGLVFYLLPRLPALGSVLGRVESAQWLGLTQALLMTGIKVFGVLLFATAWTVPFGIWVAKRPSWNKFMQPLIQNLAAFPAPVLFPLLALTMVQWGLPAGLIAMILMTIGNQWYLLFNVLSGASKISGELLEVAQLHGLSRWGRFRFVYFPTIFPSLLTGWITAAGGAWNASIVAELVRYPGGELRAEGIGAEITQATVSGQYVHLVAAVIVITIALVVVNRTLWRNMHQFAARLS